MQCTLLWSGLGVVLLSLAPSTWSFSYGANDDSCQEMIPGHIRAQRQYLQHSHITLRTSASSYLPGQRITVTVRSSRDFMGFLLQARSADGTWNRSRPRVGVRPGVKSTRMGPVLVGGSWALTPPGTHTLRCLSEGDTITHSDKQLKRNLSFVWRAPDTPMGDIRFYITVVQSYFVYWAGIESAVVRDESRRLWNGSNATKADGASTHFAIQKEEATGLTVHGQSKTKLIGFATTQGPTSKVSSATQIYTFPVTPTGATHPVLGINSSATLAFLGIKKLIRKTVLDQDTLNILGPPEGNKTDSIETSGQLLHTADEASQQTGGPVMYTKDYNSSLILHNHTPITASLSSADTIEIKTTAPLLPDSKMQRSSTQNPKLNFLEQFNPLKYSQIKLKDSNMNFQDSKMNITTNPKSRSSAVPSTIQHFPTTGLQIQSTPNPPKTVAQTSSVLFKTQSSFSYPWSSLTKSLSQIPQLKPLLRSQISLPGPFFNSQTSSVKPFLQATTSNNVSFSRTSTPSSLSQTSLRNANPSFNFHRTTPHNLFFEQLFNKHIRPHHQVVSDLPKPGTEVVQYESKTGQTVPPLVQTTTAQISSNVSFSSFPKAETFFTPILTQDEDTALRKHQSQSDIPEALGIFYQPWSPPHSQTEAYPVHTSEWTLPPSVNPRPSSHLLLTSRQVEDFRPNKDHQQNVRQQLEKFKITSPISAFGSSTTPSSHLSGATQQLTPQSSSSISTFPVSSLPRRSYTISHPSLASTMASINPSVRSALFTRSSSFFTKDQPKTSPALSDLPFPFPLSIPPHFPFAEPSSSPPVTLIASGTNPSLNFSSNVSTAMFSQVSSSASSSSNFKSQTLPSSYTISPVISSAFSIVSLDSSVSSTTSPPSPFTTSSTSTSNQSPSSFSTSFHSTTPHAGPSPAPRRSLYNPHVSSLSPVSLNRLTVGQRLQIQKHMVSSKPEPNLNPPTPRTVVYPNPLPHPNPNFKQNLGNDLKPDTDTKPKRPSIPSKTPDKDGKYPDIVTRHSTWELGMLLGCSAGLGMVLVVGVRYMYRQACGKKTEMTLTDREREYGRGERGLIHVQECGDLVRVRRIRENSFVLLAEYDILASPGD